MKRFLWTQYTPYCVVAYAGGRLLQEDPVLFQLYKDLVVANVITAEEFWANRFTVSLRCQAIHRHLGYTL